jgi:hypothetical protein
MKALGTLGRPSFTRETLTAETSETGANPGPSGTLGRPSFTGENVTAETSESGAA